MNETMEKKPLFAPQKQAGSVFTIIFKSGEPFASGTNEKYNKTWWGYDVSCGGAEYTWFATEAIHNLIVVAGVVAVEEYTIEFKSGTSAEGNNYNIWLLNGKSAKDYAQENAVAPGPSMVTPTPAAVATPTPPVPVATVSATPTPAIATPSSGLTDAQRLNILWADYENRNGLPPATLADEDLPF